MILRSFETSANGMKALIDMHDNIANNIANVNTTGYKNAMLTFKNVYDSAVTSREGIGQTSEVRDIGEISMGSEVQKISYDFSQGALLRTENPFDLAIQGDGFLKLQTQDGDIVYTRNGALTRNNNSYLVTKEGDYVLDVENKPVIINTEGMSMHTIKDLIITEKGQIEINNEKNQTFLQTIQICDFKDKDELMCVGNSRFVPRDKVANPELKADKFIIEQGSLEMSNTSLVNEMINTIKTSRNYETLSKLVKSDGDNLSRVIQLSRARLL